MSQHDIRTLANTPLDQWKMWCLVCCHTQNLPLCLYAEHTRSNFAHKMVYWWAGHKAKIMYCKGWGEGMSPKWCMRGGWVVVQRFTALYALYNSTHDVRGGTGHQQWCRGGGQIIRVSPPPPYHLHTLELVINWVISFTEFENAKSTHFMFLA